MRLKSEKSKIYVAGHQGMVGQAVWKKLKESGYTNLIGYSSEKLDLRNPSDTLEFFQCEEPDFVVLAAASVGGILAKKSYPATILSDNLAIEQSVIRASHETGVKRLLFISSASVYPKSAPHPTPEESLMTGPLEDANQWYSIAKITGQKLCEAMYRQYEDDMISVIPCNIYGPRDSFDLEEAGVVPALIRKTHEAKKSSVGDNQDYPVTLWGSGEPRREFLHVKDLARAIQFILEEDEKNIDKVSPGRIVNVGSGEDISINGLADVIREVIGHKGPIEHDYSKPDGVEKSMLDTTKINKLGWKPKISLKKGIKNTYKWFVKNRT